MPSFHLFRLLAHNFLLDVEVADLSWCQSYVQHMRYWGLPMPSVAQVLYTQPGGAERKRKRQERTKPQVKRQKQDTNCGSDATREPLDSKNYYEVILFLRLLHL